MRNAFVRTVAVFFLLAASTALAPGVGVQLLAPNGDLYSLLAELDSPVKGAEAMGIASLGPEWPKVAGVNATDVGGILTDTAFAGIAPTGDGVGRPTEDEASLPGGEARGNTAFLGMSLTRVGGNSQTGLPTDFVTSSPPSINAGPVTGSAAQWPGQTIDGNPPDLLFTDVITTDPVRPGMDTAGTPMKPCVVQSASLPSKVCVASDGTTETEQTTSPVLATSIGPQTDATFAGGTAAWEDSLLFPTIGEILSGIENNNELAHVNAPGALDAIVAAAREPATLALLGLGLAILAYSRRRK